MKYSRKNPKARQSPSDQKEIRETCSELDKGKNDLISDIMCNLEVPLETLRVFDIKL